MGLLKKVQYVPPEIAAPPGCAAVFALQCEENRQGRDTRRVIVATMVCQGLPEAGNQELAREPLPNDSGWNPGEPSRRSLHKGYADAAQTAGQKAVLVCVGCPASVLKETREAERAELLAQAEEHKRRALQELVHQRQLTEIIGELSAIGQPDPRALVPGPDPSA